MLDRWSAKRVSAEGSTQCLQRPYYRRGNVRRRAPALQPVFAAAESLGFGRVPGTLPSFYLASLDRAVLSSMGLSPDGAEYRPDLLVRVPSFRRSVFRAAVIRDRVPVSDIIQVWLDLSSQPERGEAQASEISQHALAQHLHRVELRGCFAGRTDRETLWSLLLWEGEAELGVAKSGEQIESAIHRR